MKKSEVPQNRNRALEGKSKALYAVSKSGRVEATPSTGWEVEEIVLNQALEEVDRLAQEALSRAHKGETSPLEYHMYSQRMDLAMLAQAVGRFKWRVRRHFTPEHFANIGDDMLELYARVMGINTRKLTMLPDRHETIL